MSSSSGKIASRVLKSCKTKDYEDNHVILAWDKLNNKYAPSLLTTEILFRGG
jgi:hypothetical protein